MTKYVVTGGCGFVGSNLVESLLLLGTHEDEVIVVDNCSSGYRRNRADLEYVGEACETQLYFMDVDIRDDLTQYEDLLEADVIFHIAALARIVPSFKKPVLFTDVNCQGTSQVLELARQSGARVVYAGSSSFYFDPYCNPYAFSKWIGEEYCKMYAQVYGVDVGIARFFNVYGPRMVQSGENAACLGIFQDQKRRGLPLTVTGDGEQRRDFTHVHDIASGLRAIAKSERKWSGEVFNLGLGNNYSINEVANMFEPVKIEYLPARPGEAKETLADISFSKENLGWEPVKNLPEYVSEFLKGL
jgi:UDP-glucose 4-epimerase